MQGGGEGQRRLQIEGNAELPDEQVQMVQQTRAQLRSLLQVAQPQHEELQRLLGWVEERHRELGWRLLARLQILETVEEPALREYLRRAEELQRERGRELVERLRQDPLRHGVELLVERLVEQLLLRLGMEEQDPRTEPLRELEKRLGDQLLWLQTEQDPGMELQRFVALEWEELVLLRHLQKTEELQRELRKRLAERRLRWLGLEDQYTTPEWGRALEERLQQVRGNVGDQLFLEEQLLDLELLELRRRLRKIPCTTCSALGQDPCLIIY